jgi:hypothetical protein
MTAGNGQLWESRCFNHADREAIARCPECRRYFCRECVAEHDRRLLCAACLKRLARPKRQRRTALPLRLLAAGAGVTLAWLMFYLVGRVLLTLPSAFHEGTLWNQ